MIVCSFIQFDMSGGDNMEVSVAIELMLLWECKINCVNNES